MPKTRLQFAFTATSPQACFVLKPPAAADFLRHPRAIHTRSLHNPHHQSTVFRGPSTAATLFARRHLPAFVPAKGVDILLIGHLLPNIYDARDRISQKFDILGMVYPPILVSRYLDRDELIYQPSCISRSSLLTRKQGLIDMYV